MTGAPAALSLVLSYLLSSLPTPSFSNLTSSGTCMTRGLPKVRLSSACRLLKPPNFPLPLPPPALFFTTHTHTHTPIQFHVTRARPLPLAPQLLTLPPYPPGPYLAPQTARAASPTSNSCAPSPSPKAAVRPARAHLAAPAGRASLQRPKGSYCFAPASPRARLPVT